MAMATKLYGGSPISDSLNSQDQVNVHNITGLQNLAGYVTAVLDVTTSTSFSALGMEWRPIISGVDNRYLPAFIDLKPGDSGLNAAGELPDYALFRGLIPSDVEADKVYNLYFVHPETPAAVPLIRSETGNYDGLQIRIHASATATPSFDYKLYVYYVELT